ncbi:MAG: hypothetical protein WD897_02245 [Parcubacteria group bacterium]
MKKQYLSTLFFLALVFGVFSQVSAQIETRTRTNTDLRAIYEAQMVQVEAQREKMRAEAEVRRAAAEARGDEVQARREMMNVELEAKRAQIDAKREATRVEFEAKRAETEAKRVDFQQSAAKRQVENAARVILATIERLENIIVRIESRIAKVKARGGLTAESERFVAVAKVNLSDARVVVGTFAGVDLSSERARENFERIRTAAAEAREHIRAAHQNLMMAVRSLGSVEANVEATVTSTSE